MEPIFTAATVIDEKAYAQMLLAKQRLDQRWLMIPVYLLALPAVWAMTFRIEQPHSLFGWVLRIFVLALTAAVIPRSGGGCSAPAAAASAGGSSGDWPLRRPRFPTAFILTASRCRTAAPAKHSAMGRSSVRSRRRTTSCFFFPKVSAMPSQRTAFPGMRLPLSPSSAHAVPNPAPRSCPDRGGIRRSCR